MAGLIKKGPKHKKRKYKSYKDQACRKDRPMTDDDFKRMMEDAPTYVRHNGAMKQVRRG